MGVTPGTFEVQYYYIHSTAFDRVESCVRVRHHRHDRASHSDRLMRHAAHVRVHLIAHVTIAPLHACSLTAIWKCTLPGPKKNKKTRRASIPFYPPSPWLLPPSPRPSPLLSGLDAHHASDRIDPMRAVRRAQREPFDVVVPTPVGRPDCQLQPGLTGVLANLGD